MTVEYCTNSARYTEPKVCCCIHFSLLLKGKGKARPGTGQKVQSAGVDG